MIDLPNNFLDLPDEYCDPAASRYAVLPIPYEQTVTYGRGAGLAPAAILEASAQVEWYDEELRGQFVSAGIATLGPIEPAGAVEATADAIRDVAEAVMRDEKFLLSLGGEHSITVPLVQAAAKCFGEVSVLQLDAHADLRDRYQGTKLSHACVMRRVLEATDRIAQVGTRSFSAEEVEACPQQARRFITPTMVADEAEWIDRTLALLGEQVYVTIDVDAFDPAEAPGVGTPEPGGLHWREVTALLRRVCAERRVVAADIVEVRPIPPSLVTEYLAARLAYKIIAYTQTAE